VGPADPSLHHRVVLDDGTELRMSRYLRGVAKRFGLS
jgi:hypothetical protein